MSFEIVPSAINVLPGDRQALRLRVTSLAPLWTGLTNAAVNAGREIEPVNPVLQFGGYGAHLLKSGIGQAVFEITANEIPPTGGFFGANIQDNDSSVFIAFLLNGTTGTLQFLNETGVIFSMAYTPTPGDTITLEASGSVWRGYLNGVEKTSYAPASGIDYPCFWTASMNPTFPATPKIQAPILLGEWTGITDAAWVTPPHGSLAVSSGSSNEYFNATLPGKYILKARFGGTDTQKAEAEITIPPLMLAMPDALNVSAGTNIELLTNYDQAQTTLVTWTALDGGTLNGNRWTAPAVPGFYRLRASAGTQRVMTVVTVPIYIRPTSTAGQTHVGAIGKAQTLALETNLPSPTWSCVVGSIIPTGPTTANYTAPVFLGLDRIKVTSGAVVHTVLVDIVEILPVDPTYGYSVEIDKRIVVADSEDGTRYGRVKGLQAAKEYRYELKFDNRDLTELNLIEEFWARNFPHKKFLYFDKMRNDKVCVYFDSAIKYEPGADCAIAYSFRARSARQSSY